MAGATGLLIRQGYQAEWTGFAASGRPTESYRPGKTLWDWMQLLIVPTALAIAAAYLNRQQKDVEQRQARDQQRETALQAFFTQIGELILEHDLVSSKPGDPVRTIARARTHTVLRQLDGIRKGALVRFLVESKLILDPESKEPGLPPESVITLRGADLTNADLRGVNFARVRLRGVDLTGADLRGTRLRDAEMDETTQVSAQWRALYDAVNGPADRGVLRGKDLRGADFQRQDLSRFDLRGTDLRGAHLAGVSLSETKIDFLTRLDFKWQRVWKIMNRSKEDRKPLHLQRADLSGAYLVVAPLNGADLRAADFTSANLQHAQLRAAKMEELKGAFVDLRYAWLADVNLDRANLLGAKLGNADLSNGTLRGTQLLLAKLQEANLQGADLTNAELKRADLRGTNLLGAITAEASFEGATYDDATVWPDGFDPAAVGAVREVGAES